MKRKEEFFAKLRNLYWKKVVRVFLLNRSTEALFCKVITTERNLLAFEIGSLPFILAHVLLEYNK